MNIATNDCTNKTTPVFMFLLSNKLKTPTTNNIAAKNTLIIPK